MKEKKKIIKIILVNILVLIILSLFLELIFYNMYSKIAKNRPYLFKDNKPNQTLKYTKPILYSENIIKRQFAVYNGTSTKKPVVFLGCSYIFGNGKNNTIAYNVNKLTNRTTYRRGVRGGGLCEILDQLENGTLKKEVPDAEYIIYMYINSHISRLFHYQYPCIETFITPRYKLKNESPVKIREPKIPVLYSLFTTKYIQHNLMEIKSKKEYQSYSLFLVMMKESMKYFKEQYPNTKIVVLLYPSADYALRERGSANDYPMLPQHIIEYLEDIGYIVINAEDLTDKPIRTLEYRIDDKDHPNEKAWDAIAPALVKKLNL